MPAGVYSALGCGAGMTNHRSAFRQVGFVFTKCPIARNFHNTLYNKDLHSFRIPEIGFVFSNRALSNVLVSDPRFHGDEFTYAKAEVLRISGQRPAIGFVFPQAAAGYIFIIPFHKRLCANSSRCELVLFFQTLLLILTQSAERRTLNDNQLGLFFQISRAPTRINPSTFDIPRSIFHTHYPPSGSCLLNCVFCIHFVNHYTKPCPKNEVNFRQKDLETPLDARTPSLRTPLIPPRQQNRQRPLFVYRQRHSYILLRFLLDGDSPDLVYYATEKTGEK
jgi:hypothetical protein